MQSNWVKIIEFIYIYITEVRVCGICSYVYICCKWYHSTEDLTCSLKTSSCFNKCSLFFIYFFNWSIIDAQCHVSFRCMVQWLSCTIDKQIPFHTFFLYRLLQNIEYSSLCYVIGPCWLSILYTIVCIY